MKYIHQIHQWKFYRVATKRAKINSKPYYSYEWKCTKCGLLGQCSTVYGKNVEKMDYYTPPKNWPQLDFDEFNYRCFHCLNEDEWLVRDIIT